MGTPIRLLCGDESAVEMLDGDLESDLVEGLRKCTKNARNHGRRGAGGHPATQAWAGWQQQPENGIMQRRVGRASESLVRRFHCRCSC